MADERAESILRKMAASRKDGEWFDVGHGTAQFDLTINVTAEEEAYLRALEAAVERDTETET